MRIGFIGLGNMGGPMALNLIKAGHALVVHDTRPEAAAPHRARGAEWAKSPRLASEGVEVIFTCLPGPPQVEAVALGDDGIIQGAAAGLIYVDLSTSSPSLIRRIHAVFEPKGIRVLDAPVSGGVIGAERGTLQVMVGGDEALYRQLKPVLGAMGDKVGYMGAIGCGTIAKLVHNMIGICARAVVAEGFTLGVKAGVRPEALLEALKGGAFGQGLLLTQVLPEIVFKGDFDTVRFALRLARKDMGLATELAREYDVPMAMAAIAEQTLVEAMVRGWGDKDFAAPFMLQEERAGVQVRAGRRQ
jgi:3-hydroxyisobutyrate dehydrogenase-like beta-hydroxyacid dehydrogenase